MCGIAGIISHQKISAEKVLKMVYSMGHRGPDGFGVWSNADGTIVLGHSRLSIIDLSENAHQPMSILNGRYAITFNGEIYNYKQLKIELEKQGAFFMSSSDTEVILWGWHLNGSQFVNKLRGMFAFCLRDEELNKTYFVRDRVGIKPLLYSKNGNKVLFASSISAIFTSGEITKKVSDLALFDLLSMGVVAQPRTIIENVFALKPGTIITIDKNLSISTETYWSVSNIEVSKSHDMNDFPAVVAMTRNLLEDACRFHLVADVPVGSFLSGGVDSTAITALMSNISGQRINSFTIGFESNGRIQNELFEASAAAKYIGTNHHEIVLSDKDIAKDFDRFINAIDQPSIDGLNTYWVSKMSHNYVKVALSGLGADEIFSGYDSFLMMKKASESNPHFHDRILAQFYSRYKNKYTFQSSFRISDPKFRQTFFRRVNTDSDVLNLLSDDYKSKYLGHHFEEYVLSLNTFSQDPVAMYSKYEVQGYLLNMLLRDADALSMGNSIEVRPVFLDHKLLELGLSIPGDIKLNKNITKAVLKEATKDLVPAGFFERKKKGFSLPLHEWINGALKPLITDCFTNQNSGEFFDCNELNFLLHNIKDIRYTNRIWLMAVTISWIHKNIHNNESTFPFPG